MEKKKDKKAPQSKLETEPAKNEKLTKKTKPKLGEVTSQVSNLTPEDMLTWSEYKLQEPIMRALTESGFKNPTKIQQLTLPAAIHGKLFMLRLSHDILFRNFSSLTNIYLHVYLFRLKQTFF